MGCHIKKRKIYP